MEKKSSEKKDFPIRNDQTKSLKVKVIGIARENWLALLCALIISLLTIIVVPIIYKLDKPHDQNNQTNLSWDINGQTIVNQTYFVNQIENNTIGNISSLAFDLQNNLYLLDKEKHRLLIYQFHSNLLNLKFGHLDGLNGTDLHSLSSPNDFVLTSINLTSMYIVDTFNDRILLIQLNSSITEEAQLIFGSGISGSNSIQLNRPMSITWDGQSMLYIADYGNNQIVSWNILTNESKIIIPYNPTPNRQGYVLTPISIRYYYSSLVIGQETGFNVVRWNLSSNTNNWNLIAGSASSQLSGTSRTLFNRVCSIDSDDRGNTYVNDCINQRIQFYNGDMKQGKTIAGVIQAQGNNSYIFDFPTAFALDSLYNLYVADSNNFRIQKFQQLH